VHVYTVYCGKLIFAVTVQWTVTTLLQNEWKKRNKNTASETQRSRRGTKHTLRGGTKRAGGPPKKYLGIW